MSEILRRYGKFLVLGILVVLAGWWIYSRYMVSDETRVLRALEKARRVVENHSVTGVVDVISPNYRDEWGHAAGEIRAVAVQVMRTFPVIEIDVVDPEVSVEGDKAEVVCYARAVVEDETGKREDVGRHFTMGDPIRFEFEKKDREWRISGIFRVKEAN